MTTIPIPEEQRTAPDLETLGRKVAALRELGLKIVLTQGSYDMFHVGHSRYLAKAKECGDVLIVGVDSNEKIQKRKGPNRPVVDEAERMEILSNQRSVDLLILKRHDWKPWGLIRAVHPDILIATKETYDEAELADLKDLCGEVRVLEPQAETSTTGTIRRLFVDGLDVLSEEVSSRIPKLLKDSVAAVISSTEKKHPTPTPKADGE
jgi:D-beta-D-heptose 7-phosphate kinase/D-beta-D-heptose 1-phosphate adenosyltransferase